MSIQDAGDSDLVSLSATALVKSEQCANALLAPGRDCVDGMHCIIRHDHIIITVAGSGSLRDSY